MTKGRKPTPSKIKKLRGNPDHRPRNMDEPEFETAIPEPPAHLSAAALVEWNRITHELAAKNVITIVDQAIIALYCQAYAQWAYHSDQLEQEEHFLTTPKGYRYMNPQIGLINTLGEKLAKYAAELGITPSSRSRIKVTATPPAPRDKQRSLAEKFFSAKIAK